MVLLLCLLLLVHTHSSRQGPKSHRYDTSFFHSPKRYESTTQGISFHRCARFVCSVVRISPSCLSSLSSSTLPPLFPLHLPPNNLPQPLLQILTLAINIHSHIPTTQAHSPLHLLSTTHLLGHFTCLFPLLVTERPIAFIQQQPPIAREREHVHRFYRLCAKQLACGRRDERRRRCGEHDEDGCQGCREGD